jgi:hypothetical protein
LEAVLLWVLWATDLWVLQGSGCVLGIDVAAGSFDGGIAFEGVEGVAFVRLVDDI